MLDAMPAIGRALGWQEAWVNTEPDNLPARFYEARPEPGEPAQTFVMYAYTL